jgi:hypothetical protein
MARLVPQRTGRGRRVHEPDRVWAPLRRGPAWVPARVRAARVRRGAQAERTAERRRHHGLRRTLDRARGRRSTRRRRRATQAALDPEGVLEDGSTRRPRGHGAGRSPRGRAAGVATWPGSSNTSSTQMAPICGCWGGRSDRARAPPRSTERARPSSRRSRLRPWKGCRRRGRGVGSAGCPDTS